MLVSGLLMRLLPVMASEVRRVSAASVMCETATEEPAMGYSSSLSELSMASEACWLLMWWSSSIMARPLASYMGDRMHRRVRPVRDVSACRLFSLGTGPSVMVRDCKSLRQLRLEYWHTRWPCGKAHYVGVAVGMGPHVWACILLWCHLLLLVPAATAILKTQ